VTDLVLAVPGRTELVGSDLGPSIEHARAFAAASRSDNTRRTYQGQWHRFVEWSRGKKLEPLPAEPEAVALYLAELATAGRKASGIELALTAISMAHTLAGFDSPRRHTAVREVRKGIRRTIGTAQTGKAPLLVDALRVVLGALPHDRAGLRDRALLLVGWAGALRRSEIVGLDVSAFRWTPLGLEVQLGRTKTDQEGEGAKLGLPLGSTPDTCPGTALRAWLDAAEIVDGAAFRAVDRWGNLGERLSGAAVARVLKRRAIAAGADIEVAELAGHSLRAGLATQAARSGAAEAAIMRQTRHTSVQMVRRYIRDGDLWRDNAAATTGL
jgi:integrase